MRIEDGSKPQSASTNHLIFAYCVTGHGFGHATRVIEVTVAYNKDTSPNKLNLGVGAYRTEEGKPVVLNVVRKAEQLLVNDQTKNKEYLPIIGLADFNKFSAKLILGADRDVPSSAALPIIRPALGRQHSISDRAKGAMQGYLNHVLGNMDIVNSREVCKFLEVSNLSFSPEYGPKLKEDYVMLKHLPKIAKKEDSEMERMHSHSLVYIQIIKILLLDVPLFVVANGINSFDERISGSLIEFFGAIFIFILLILLSVLVRNNEPDRVHTNILLLDFDKILGVVCLHSGDNPDKLMRLHLLCIELVRKL
ncbi:hypothetical protein ACFE04_020139 [Oxalis oulophora]